MVKLAKNLRKKKLPLNKVSKKYIEKVLPYLIWKYDNFNLIYQNDF